MVTFYLAENEDKIHSSEEYISLDENIHNKLQDNNYYGIDTSIIGDIPMFGNIDFFNDEEIIKLLDVCDQLIQYTWDMKEEASSNKFFLKLHSMCQKAMEKKYIIATIGD